MVSPLTRSSSRMTFVSIINIIKVGKAGKEVSNQMTSPTILYH